MKKKKNENHSWPRTTACMNFTGSPYVCIGFLMYSCFVPHPTDRHAGVIGVSQLPLSECGSVSVPLTQWNGVLQTWFPPCTTTSSRGDSSCLRSWTEISLLENQDYKWLFNVKCFGSAFRSLVLFLWPGMCGRNFTLVCIKFPVLKLISLYVILHKVSVSKNLLMLLSENLLYS